MDDIIAKIVGIVAGLLVTAILGYFGCSKGCSKVGGDVTKVVAEGATKELLKEGPTSNSKNIKYSENNNTNNNSNHHSTDKKNVTKKTSKDGKYSYASTRYLSDDELKNMSKYELKIMRNEIFARYGYVFKTDDMKRYFNNQSWYLNKAKLPYNDDGASYLTDIEIYNIKLIKRYE